MPPRDRMEISVVSKRYIDHQHALGILHVDVQPQAVCHGLLHHHDLLRLYIGIFDQVVKGPLLHIGDVRRHRDIEVRRPTVSLLEVGDEIPYQRFHILDISDDAVGQGVRDMNIAGGLLIHFKCRVPICKQNLLVLYGDHVLFHHDAVVAPAIDFNVVCT